MSDDLADLMVHTVTVRTLTGTTGTGTTYANPVTFDPATDSGVLVDDRRRLVRSTDGSQVVSETTIYDTRTEHATTWTPGSKVTLPNGRRATVITVAVRTVPGMDLPEHIEVTCT